MRSISKATATRCDARCPYDETHSVKLILGTDSLQPPLTGVGRYTYELAVRFLDHPEIDELLGFDLGHFHDVRERVQRLQRVESEAERRSVERITLAMRRTLAKSVLVLRLYEEYANHLSSRRLRAFADSIFHSPNYHLPAGHARSVVTIHDMSHVLHSNYHPRARVAWMQRTVPKAIDAAAHILCVSQSTRADLLANQRVDPERVSVTTLGVDPSFAPQTPEAIAALMSRLALSAGSYFLCIATLEPRKNIDGLLSAYLALPASLRKGIPLVLAGTPGWKCEGLQARIAAAATEGVRYLGYVGDSDLPALYGGALCFTYPSYYEGFGLPVLEAQACGAPVISSDCSSLPEVASDEALLVNPYDLDALGAAMARAVEDRPWRDACRASGLAKAQEFSWDRCAQETISVYRKVLQSA